MSQEEMTYENWQPNNPTRARIGNLLLWGLVLTSLALNVFVIFQLISIRRSAREAVLQASGMLTRLQDETISLSIPVNETIMIDTEVRVQDTVVVPVQADIPVGGAASVGPLSVPFGATVPIDISVDVPIDTTIPIHMPVEVNFEVPVEISLADTPLAGLLDEVQLALDEMATELSGPFSFN